MVKPDWWIRAMSSDYPRIIEPFSERIAGPEVVSWGLQPAGYDARLAPVVSVVDWTVGVSLGLQLDPLRPDDRLLFKRSADPFILLPPHGYMVGMTLEYFRIPRNCVVRGVAKTTYSRVGVSFEVASIHPGWEGHLLLHISNTTSVPVKVYGGQGIVYLEFHEIDGEVERDYSEIEGTRFQRQGEGLLLRV